MNRQLITYKSLLPVLTNPATSVSVFINKEKVKDMYYANLMYEHHRITEKIRLFEKKYGVSVQDFEDGIKGSEKEDFEKWDDYMEWKGYVKVLQRLSEDKKDLEVGNYKVS